MRGVEKPNQTLQPTGHANNGSARYEGFSRVNRLLSWVVRVRHDVVTVTVMRVIGDVTLPAVLPAVSYRDVRHMMCEALGTT